MNNLNKIICEEISNYLIESGEDIDWDLYEKFENIKQDVLYGFLENKKKGIKNQPWRLVPFGRLKKIWEDFVRYGIVRDERGLDMIDRIIQNNIIKLYINTELVGHTSHNTDDDFDDAGFTEEDKEDFFDYIDKYSDYAFNDFSGLRLGLLTLLSNLRKSNTPEEKLGIIDQILNVAHQRSDLASWFVEGGSNALSQLSGTN